MRSSAIEADAARTAELRLLDERFMVIERATSYSLRVARGATTVRMLGMHFAAA